MKYSKYSAVIIGSGVSGLYLALKLEEEKKFQDGILIVTKSGINECNSRFAQGGIVAVMPENKKDSVSLHVSDTLRAGCGLCNFDTVNFISKNSAKVIKDLYKIGVPFDKNKKEFAYTMEAAHSIPRILHAGGDSTGAEIERVLCEKVIKSKNIDIYENTMAVELLMDLNKKCRGVLVYNTLEKTYEAIHSNTVILASGGVGQVYKNTTNPPVTTGDGLAIAKKAGAEIENMEFIQFHPTALKAKYKENLSLISESVRGEGAKLTDENGNRFMYKYDTREELAPRDVVARAVFDQENTVFLDISPIGLEHFKTRFPSITRICEENNINLDELKIPVTPAAHYCMGGVKAKVDGRTSIENLYAIGEVSSTGLHGANRLASNSLLECVVCAWALANSLTNKNLEAPKTIDEEVRKIIELYGEDFEDIEVDAEKLIKEIQETMWQNVGIVRNVKGLMNAKMKILEIERIFKNKYKCQTQKEYELRNMIEVSKTIIQSALERKDSIGAHFRSDTLNNQIEKVKEEANNRYDTIFVK